MSRRSWARRRLLYVVAGRAFQNVPSPRELRLLALARLFVTRKEFLPPSGSPGVVGGVAVHQFGAGPRLYKAAARPRRAHPPHTHARSRLDARDRHGHRTRHSKLAALRASTEPAHQPGTQAESRSSSAGDLAVDKAIPHRALIHTPIAPAHLDAPPPPRAVLTELTRPPLEPPPSARLASMAAPH